MVKPGTASIWHCLSAGLCLRVCAHLPGRHLCNDGACQRQARKALQEAPPILVVHSDPLGATLHRFSVAI